MKARYAFGIPIAMCAALGGTALGASLAAPPQTTACHATQPVYTSSKPFIVIGRWEAWIPRGASVRLPDGDTAVCDNDGQVQVP